ncbi:MAG: permease-like cell division protein FtsX [Desulfobacterales bacterium]
MTPRPLRHLAADLRAHRLLHGVTVLTVTLAALIAGATLLAASNAREALETWRRETRILVYLHPLSGGERSALGARLQALEGVRAVTFLPREEAYRELQTLYPHLAVLFDPLEEPPLPDGFEVEPREAALAAVERLAERIRALPEVEEVVYPRRWFEGLQALLDFLQRGGLMLLGLSLLTAVSMVAATTRLVLLARREEIELLELFGAGRGLLHGRFLLGGVLQGFVGGLLGLGLLRLLYDALLPAAEGLARAAGLTPRFLSPGESAGLVLGAVLVGALGAVCPLRRSRAGVILGLAAVLLAAGPSAATEPEDPATVPLEHEADTLRREQQEMEIGLERLQRREHDVAAELERAARALREARRRVAAARREHEALEHRLGLLEEAREDLGRRLGALQQELSRRLRALHGLHRLGPATAGGPLPASPAGLLRAEAGLSRLLARDARLLAALQADAGELADLEARIAAATERLRENLARTEEEVRALEQSAADRERLLAKIRGDRDARRIAAERLAEARGLIEEQLRRRTAERPPAFETASPHPAGPPIAEAKGLLLFPLQGSMKIRHVPQHRPGVSSSGSPKGIEIAAGRGEPVRAVHGGVVLFADWLGGYGNMIIIDHGDHFYSLYAHLEDLFTAPDRRVSAGDVIATVGDSGALGGSSLYFELRHGERSLDPRDWFPRH